MLRTPVRSSNLQSVCYDHEGCVLEVEFHDRHVYQYRGVRSPTFESLMRAWSKGSYFHAYIKDRYACRQVA
jgi:hypothetical protein